MSRTFEYYAEVMAEKTGTTYDDACYAFDVMCIDGSTDEGAWENTLDFMVNHLGKERGHTSSELYEIYEDNADRYLCFNDMDFFDDVADGIYGDGMKYN